jgi:predicted MPP superfamily phosphohydrolase
MDGPPYIASTALPERLRSWPSPRRRALHEFLDIFAVGLNRAIGDTRWAKALHRRALAQMEYSEVPFAVGPRPGLDGLRIAFLTDLHAGSYLDADDLHAVFAEVARRAPDLVCFGGDLINSRPEELDLLDEPLRLLRPRLGCFAVPGNHDHRWYPDMGDWHDRLRRGGVEVLNNHGLRIQNGGDSFWLCGVDDLTDGRPDLRRALWGRGRDEPTLLLAHQPDHFPEAAAHGIDLTLSGHTHGGQLRFFGWAPITHTRHGFTAGGFEHERSRLYVSRGVGVTVLPLRTGARPEVPFIELRATAR